MVGSASPRRIIEPSTPMTGLASAPSDAVAVGSLPTMLNPEEIADAGAEESGESNGRQVCS